MPRILLGHLAIVSTEKGENDIGRVREMLGATRFVLACFRVFAGLGLVVSMILVSGGFEEEFVTIGT